MSRNLKGHWIWAVWLSLTSKIERSRKWLLIKSCNYWLRRFNFCVSFHLLGFCLSSSFHPFTRILSSSLAISGHLLPTLAVPNFHASLLIFHLFLLLSLIPSVFSFVRDNPIMDIDLAAIVNVARTSCSSSSFGSSDRSRTPHVDLNTPLRGVERTSCAICPSETVSLSIGSP